jgi:hypothetical protein
MENSQKQTIQELSIKWTDDNWKEFLFRPAEVAKAVAVVAKELNQNHFVSANLIFLDSLVKRSCIPIVNLIEISDLAKGDCEILDESIVLFLVNCAQKFESLGLLNFIPRIQAKLGRRKKPVRTEFEVFYTDIYKKLIAVIDDIERGH